MKWLDQVPLAPLALVALMLAAAPFAPKPHLVEKLQMLAAGQLRRPIDVFDLFLHGAPLAVLVAKLVRMSLPSA